MKEQMCMLVAVLIVAVAAVTLCASPQGSPQGSRNNQDRVNVARAIPAPKAVSVTFKVDGVLSSFDLPAEAIEAEKNRLLVNGQLDLASSLRGVDPQAVVNQLMLDYKALLFRDMTNQNFKAQSRVDAEKGLVGQAQAIGQAEQLEQKRLLGLAPPAPVR